MVIEAILFDLDGTLIDSRSGFLNALNACSKRFGFQPLKDVKFDMPVKDIIKNYITDDNKKVEKLLECYRIVYSEFWRETLIMEGAREILNWLKNKGIKIGVVTDRRILIDYVKPTLEFLGIDKFIDVLVTLKEAGESKPSPKPFLFASSKLSVDPSNCVIVGDLTEDILSGKSAGMTTVAYLSGYSDGEKMLKAKPDFHIEKLGNLRDFL
jgi:HAD superfamily hydrolase (TIGR01509 family)